MPEASHIGRVFPHPPGCPLTARELECLQLLAFGYTLKETAEAMGIAENTVAGKRIRIYDKLGVNTGAGAVGVAYRARWIR